MSLPGEVICGGNIHIRFQCKLKLLHPAPKPRRRILDVTHRNATSSRSIVAPGHPTMGLRPFTFLIICAAGFRVPCHGADLQEIIRRGTAAIKTDWAADPDYAY